MSDNFYPPNDPAQGRPPYPQPGQGPQGRLILGKGGAHQEPGPHRPTPSPYPPAGPQRPPLQPASYGQIHHQPQQPHRQDYAHPPVNQAYVPQTDAPGKPFPKPGQMMNPAIKTRRGRKNKGCAIGCATMLVILIGAIIFGINVTQHVLAFGSAISPQSPLSTQTGYMTGSTRTNLLIMGYGGAGHDGALLTDSMSVISMIPSTGHTTMISVPRDLWIQYPDNSGNYNKLNAVYEYGANFQNTGQNRINGGNATAQKISQITGLNIKYWMTIDFAGFTDFINSLGGVNVYVQNTFTANYPINDDPNINAGWKTVTFKKGEQHMDGQTAIEYSRAREVISGDLAEGTDFARSARQQIVMKAALDEMKSTSSWSRLYDEMNALKSAVYTNMSLADLMLFAEKMNLNNPNTKKIGLSDSNVLQDGSLANGTYILQPLDGDWSKIPAYIRQNLYN
jgi:polyisoprenyl-teichoic acid--peptidoglycan teichoic acid transferase